MKPYLRLIPLMIVLASPMTAHASGNLFYVRVDGGDHLACSGRSDRSLAAALAEGDQDCAWQHPFTALPPGAEPRIAGGDTLFIRAGAYRMGLGAPGAERCDRNWPWDCFMAALPSGPSVQRPTRLSGADADGVCHGKPELWGTERAARVLNLDGSSRIEVSCLEITDRSSCVENHCHGGECADEVMRCARESHPFGDWSGTGVFARDSESATLRDLNVHGLALRGFHVGRVRDWRLERVVIRGNGWSGWDGDLNGADSSNSGTLEFIDVEISWNGCAERYPGGEPFGCWGQSSGGYGDGLGTAATAGDWRFDRVHVHHNTSDGLDMLYLQPPGRVSVTRSRIYANAGDQLKASGALTLTDSHINGSCGDLGAAGGLHANDHCRSGGNAVSVSLWSETDIRLHDNELRGHGDCLVVVGDGDASSRVRLRGNRLHGSPMWRTPTRLVCGFYAHRTSATVEIEDNEFTGLRHGQCPPKNRCQRRSDPRSLSALAHRKAVE